MVSTRSRITSLPALAVGTLAASFTVGSRAMAQDATPVPSPVADPFAGLDLPALGLVVTAEGFEGIPASLEAGRYVLRVSGEAGPDDYMLGGLIAQFPDGVTLEDVTAEVAASEREYPPIFYNTTLAGGKLIMAAMGETSAASVIDLTPGTWHIIEPTFLRAPLSFEVTGEMPADMAVPEANVTLEMGEMYFKVADGAFVAGDNIVEIVNAGAQPHFAEIVMVPDGTTNDNIAALIALEMGGTPEAEPVDTSQATVTAFLAEQSAGITSWAPLSLQAGTYALLCFVGEPQTGMPHAMMGMHDVFIVD